MIYFVAVILFLFVSTVQAGDCDEQIVVMEAQLKIINEALQYSSGTRPTVLKLDGTCEQKRDILAQATYDARVAAETVAKPTRDDRPASLQCDVYISKTERAQRFCWTKP